MRVIMDGVPLRMIIDTGAVRSHLSLRDAQRLRSDWRATDSYIAERVDAAGWSLRNVALEISPGAPHSVIGLDWLGQLGEIMLDPTAHTD